MRLVSRTGKWRALTLLCVLSVLSSSVLTQKKNKQEVRGVLPNNGHQSPPQGRPNWHDFHHLGALDTCVLFACNCTTSVGNHQRGNRTSKITSILPWSIPPYGQDSWQTLWHQPRGGHEPPQSQRGTALHQGLCFRAICTVMAKANEWTAIAANGGTARKHVKMTQQEEADCVGAVLGSRFFFFFFLKK